MKKDLFIYVLIFALFLFPCTVINASYTPSCSLFEKKSLTNKEKTLFTKNKKGEPCVEGKCLLLCAYVDEKKKSLAREAAVTYLFYEKGEFKISFGSFAYCSPKAKDHYTNLSFLLFRNDYVTRYFATVDNTTFNKTSSETNIYNIILEGGCPDYAYVDNAGGKSNKVCFDNGNTSNNLKCKNMGQNKFLNKVNFNGDNSAQAKIYDIRNFIKTDFKRLNALIDEIDICDEFLNYEAEELAEAIYYMLSPEIYTIDREDLPIKVKEQVGKETNHLIDAFNDNCIDKIQNDPNLSEKEKKEKTKAFNSKAEGVKDAVFDGLGIYKIKKGKSKAINCEDFLDEKGNNIIKEIWSIIIIVAPILVILLGSLDFAKATLASDEEAMKKSQSNFMKRLLAGILLFLLPQLIKVMFFIAKDLAHINIPKPIFCIFG